MIEQNKELLLNNLIKITNVEFNNLCRISSSKRSLNESTKTINDDNDHYVN